MRLKMFIRIILQTIFKVLKNKIISQELNSKKQFLFLKVRKTCELDDKSQKDQIDGEKPICLWSSFGEQKRDHLVS